MFNVDKEISSFNHLIACEIVAAVDDWDKNSLISKVDLSFNGKKKSLSSLSEDRQSQRI